MGRVVGKPYGQFLYRSWVIRTVREMHREGYGMKTIFEIESNYSERLQFEN